MKECVPIMKKKSVEALLLAAIVASQQVPALALPTVMPDGSVFDSAYYASTYPDVVAVYGTDAMSLYSHYVSHGKTEGRLAYDPVSLQEVAAAAAEEAKTRNVQAAILALKSTYPEGMSWTNENQRYENLTWWLIGRGCVAFAMRVSDAVYGANTKVNYLYEETPDTLKVGDAVKYVPPGKTYTHWFVVTDVNSTSITICEGNYNGAVHWGRVVTKDSLKGTIVRVARRG